MEVNTLSVDIPDIVINRDAADGWMDAGWKSCYNCVSSYTMLSIELHTDMVIIIVHAYGAVA